MFTQLKIKLNTVAKNYLSTIKERKNFALTFHFVSFAFIIGLFMYTTCLSAPESFPEKIFFSLERGKTLGETATLLKEAGIIKSDFWFKKIVIVLNGENNIQAGEYLFDKPQNAYTIAERVISGRFDFLPIKITVPEGLTVREMADLFEKNLPKFDQDEFIMLASKKEGFLFPDTYSFSPNIKSKKVIEMMEDNFDKRIRSIDKELKQFNKPIQDIITMASIVETESRTEESRKQIAGILWRRMEIGMPLQVDVTFKYVNGKNSFELTSSDLVSDSPYNTYTHAGLPPTPIANPGMGAILATIEPEPSDYLYFLSDKSGGMHYAKTHDEHVANKKLYLR